MVAAIDKSMEETTVKCKQSETNPIGGLEKCSWGHKSSNMQLGGN